MKPWKMLVGVNGVLLAALLLVAGPLRSPLNAQFDPRLSDCCKTAIEGSKFCCSECCGTGYYCLSSCRNTKRT
jgi:hypothetical protein